MALEVYLKTDCEQPRMKKLRESPRSPRLCVGRELNAESQSTLRNAERAQAKLATEADALALAEAMIDESQQELLRNVADTTRAILKKGADGT